MFDSVDLRDWNEYVRLLVGLLALINPLTVLPIFLGLVQGRAEAEKRHISTVASVTVLVTLLIFTYFGGALLDLFAITIVLPHRRRHPAAADRAGDDARQGRSAD